MVDMAPLWLLHTRDGATRPLRSVCAISRHFGPLITKIIAGQSVVLKTRSTAAGPPNMIALLGVQSGLELTAGAGSTADRRHHADAPPISE